MQEQQFNIPNEWIRPKADICYALWRLELEYIEATTLFKNLILSGAAITGAVVAVKGLSTWNRQLKGQHEYELSRRILVSLFKFRDVIFAVRRPPIWQHEMESPPDEEKRSEEYIRHYGLSKAYQARWKKVLSEKTVLYTDLLEAEAIWGSELRNPFKKIFDLERELYSCVLRYLELLHPDTTKELKEELQKIHHDKRNILYDNLSEEPDEYVKEFIAAVEEVELYLKPKLKQK